jgi:hypothetical protein
LPVVQFQRAASTRYREMPVTAPPTPRKLALAPNDQTPPKAFLQRLERGEFEIELEHRRRVNSPGALGRRRGSVRVSEPVRNPAKVGVELVARNEAGSDPAGDCRQLATADQCANLVLGAAELGGDLADGQWCGPVHARSIAAPPHNFGTQAPSGSASSACV